MVLQKLPFEPNSQGYTSPDGTIPFPQPESKYRPTGYWECQPTAIEFRVPTVVGNTARTGAWASAVFDLRPDLVTAESKTNVAFRMQRLAGAQLFVSIAGLTSNHLGMEVFARVLAHATDVSKLAAALPDQNITASLSTGLDSATISFLPFSGYPVRFWQVQLRFDFLTFTVPATMPKITVQAGMY